MFPLILFLCALAGAVLVQAFIRILIAPRRRAASARSTESRQQLGDWENEGGALAVGSGSSVSTVFPHAPAAGVSGSGAAADQKAA